MCLFERWMNDSLPVKCVSCWHLKCTSLASQAHVLGVSYVPSWRLKCTFLAFSSAPFRRLKCTFLASHVDQACCRLKRVSSFCGPLARTVEVLAVRSRRGQQWPLLRPRRISSLKCFAAGFNVKVADEVQPLQMRKPTRLTL